jgi:hypothetical protein
MDLSREILTFVFDVELGGLERVGAVVMGDHEEAGRGVGGDAEAFAELGLVLLLEEAAAVDEDREIGAARVVDAGLLLVGARRAVPRSMADEVGAGGEADHADALRVDVPFLGVGADEPERALQVTGRGSRRAASHRPSACGSASRMPADAEAVEPFADARAFVLGRQEPVAAARADDDRGAGRSRSSFRRCSSFSYVLLRSPGSSRLPSASLALHHLAPQ